MSKVNALQLSMADLQREMLANKGKNLSKAQQLNNMTTTVTPHNFHVGIYFLVRLHFKRRHNLQTRYVGRRKIVEAQSMYIYVVRDVIKGDQECICVQRMLLHPVGGKGDPPSKMKKDHATYLQMIFNFVDEIYGVVKSKREYLVHIRWL